MNVRGIGIDIVRISRMRDVIARWDERFLMQNPNLKARAVVEAGYGLLELSAERLTLEDIFVRLVTTESP